MGNTSLTCASGAKVPMIRVLLPDGNIVHLDEPVEVVELMIEHINHMVVHCSDAKPGSTSAEERTMRIMQPSEKLIRGQSYVVHPIPTQRGNQKTVSFEPQPLSVQNRKSKVAAVPSRRDKTNQAAERKPEPLRRGSSKVVDSNSVHRPKADNAATRDYHHVSAKEEQNRRVSNSNDDGNDEVVLNLNMYMGWRPALESIPESPLGYHHSLEMMQTPPVLCV